MGKNEICPETPHLILCEGADAYFFLMWFLDFLKKVKKEFAAFRVYDFGGIKDLKPYLNTMIKTTDDFKSVVKSISIIRDAEKDAVAAAGSIKSTLQSLGFSVPQEPCIVVSGSDAYPQIPTGFVLFPTISQTPENGTLEDLCLRILSKTDAASRLTHADTALEKYKDDLPQLHKNRLHAFFSMTDDLVSLKLGEAARCRAFNYDSSDMVSLKSFLEKMLEVK